MPVAFHATGQVRAALCSQVGQILYHIGFQNDKVLRYILPVKLIEDRMQDLFSRRITTFDGVVAAHQHFRFNDREEPASWHKAA